MRARASARGAAGAAVGYKAFLRGRPLFGRAVAGGFGVAAADKAVDVVAYQAGINGEPLGGKAADFAGIGAAHGTGELFLEGGGSAGGGFRLHGAAP